MPTISTFNDLFLSDEKRFKRAVERTQSQKGAITGYHFFDVCNLLLGCRFINLAE